MTIWDKQMMTRDKLITGSKNRQRVSIILEHHWDRLVDFIVLCNLLCYICSAWPRGLFGHDITLIILEGGNIIFLGGGGVPQ